MRLVAMIPSEKYELILKLQEAGFLCVERPRDKRITDIFDFKNREN